MVTGNATTKLQRQILSYSAQKHQDLGYHTLNPTSATMSTSSLESVPRSSPSSNSTTEAIWDVRATKTPIRDLHIMTHNAKHSPVSRSSTPKMIKSKSARSAGVSSGKNPFNRLPDGVVLRILSYLNTNDLVVCSRISRRFYFLAWDPELWTSVSLSGEGTDADLALKTIMRLLSRNSARSSLESLVLNGCSRLTDRGLAIIARTSPSLSRLEIQHCVNITNGGLMDLVTKCQMLDHLDVTGKLKPLTKERKFYCYKWQGVALQKYVS